ncbi:MAG: Flp pilus assembly protein CpaB [Pseudobdellovibrionaceae bacterium]
MTPNETRTLWISLVAGLFATFMLYSYSQEKKAEYDKKFGSMVTVLVATKDIAEMTTIDDTMVEVREKPSDFIEPGVIKEKELVIGQVAATPIRSGEQILGTKLLTPGPDTGLSLQVSPNRRAVTVAIDEMRGVAKLIRPGDRVDVFAALDVGKGLNMRRETQLLIQDVPVLATGLSVRNNIPRLIEVENSQNLSLTSLAGDSKYTHITLEVAPKDAQDLVHIMATSAGNLFFTLRHPNDRVNLPRMPASSTDSISGKPIIPSFTEAPPSGPMIQRGQPQKPGFRTL